MQERPAFSHLPFRHYVKMSCTASSSTNPLEATQPHGIHQTMQLRQNAIVALSHLPTFVVLVSVECGSHVHAELPQTRDLTLAEACCGRLVGGWGLFSMKIPSAGACSARPWPRGGWRWSWPPPLPPARPSCCSRVAKPSRRPPLPPPPPPPLQALRVIGSTCTTATVSATAVTTTAVSAMTTAAAAAAAGYLHRHQRWLCAVPSSLLSPFSSSSALPLMRLQ